MLNSWSKLILTSRKQVETETFFDGWLCRKKEKKEDKRFSFLLSSTIYERAAPAGIPFTSGNFEHWLISGCWNMKKTSRSKHEWKNRRRIWIEREREKEGEREMGGQNSFKRVSWIKKMLQELTQEVLNLTFFSHLSRNLKRKFKTVFKSNETYQHFIGWISRELVRKSNFHF